MEAGRYASVEVPRSVEIVDGRVDEHGRNVRLHSNTSNLPTAPTPTSRRLSQQHLATATSQSSTHLHSPNLLHSRPPSYQRSPPSIITHASSRDRAESGTSNNPSSNYPSAPIAPAWHADQTEQPLPLVCLLLFAHVVREVDKKSWLLDLSE